MLPFPGTSSLADECRAFSPEEQGKPFLHLEACVVPTMLCKRSTARPRASSKALFTRDSRIKNGVLWCPQMADYDALIVGGGLAGSWLAWRFACRGRRVCLVDDGSPVAGSRAAAGLINPVSGFRLTKPAMLDEWLPASRDLYRELELAALRPLVRLFPALRIFAGEDERQRWDERRPQPAFRAWLGDRHDACPLGAPIRAPYGSADVHGALVVDVPGTLDALVAAAGDRLTWIREPMDAARLVRDGGDWRWCDVAAPWVIHCQGAGVVDDPLWGEWPWEISVGETLVIEAPGLPVTHVLTGGLYVVPTGGNRFQVGATYDRSGRAAAPSEAGREELEEGLGRLIATEYRVATHRAGSRVNTRRRRPVAGRHPTALHCAVINGLASRGVYSAPVLAERLVAHIVDGSPMDRAVSPATHLARRG